MHRTAALVASCLALFLLGTASAGAATPFTVGSGETPDIAVDPSGKAHLAFLDKSPDPQVARYCQLSRNGIACAAAKSFEEGDPSSVFGRAHVFLPGANQVVVAYNRCCGGAGTPRRAAGTRA